MGHKVEETDQTHERKKHALTISFSSLNTQKCFLLDVVLFLEASAFFLCCVHIFSVRFPALFSMLIHMMEHTGERVRA